MCDGYSSPARAGGIYPVAAVDVTDADLISTSWDISDVQAKCDVIQLDIVFFLMTST